MWIHAPRGWRRDGRGLLLVADVRNKADRECDAQTPEDAPHVLELWPPGREALGPGGWRQTARIALFDSGTHPPPPQRIAAKKNLLTQIRHLNPGAIAVLQTRSATARSGKARDAEGELGGMDGTFAWNALQPPGSLPDCAGAWVTSPHAPCPILGLLNPVNHEHVYAWLTAEHLKRAFALASFTDVTRETIGELSRATWRAQTLEAVAHFARAGMPVSVDIESVPSQDVITLVGLAAGDACVSVDWDAYSTSENGPLPGGTPHEKARVKEILELNCVKVGHNFVASDAPALAKRGIRLGGPLWDTMIMFGLAFPQFKKGLQHAVATLMPCPAWKTQYKPTTGSNSATAEYWAWDHHKLAAYNRQDAWYTLKLAEKLVPLVGVA